VIRLIIYFAIIYFAINLIKALISPKKNGKSRNNNSGEDMVEDPSCGTFIPKSSALEKKSGGEKLYFCSKECWQQYKDKVKK
jgi:YHS domain-containing protein